MSSTKWASSSRIGTALSSRRDKKPDVIISRPKTAKEDIGLGNGQQQFLTLPGTQVQQGRPSSSLIRPLSGQVFMRRTVKNGWVAKGIGGRNSSVIDLEKDGTGDDEEPLGSDAGSLDSFFDDDFEEKDLDNLLSCNTLGIESKGHKPDWRSGELAIPEFHCPRCRDHWYGLTAYPCDEELARLIREGKWYLGKDGNKTGNKSDTGNRDRSKDSKDMTNGSTDSLSLPSINKKRGTSAFQTNKSNHHIDFVTPGSRDKKKNRRITFKIEGDELDNDASNSSLNDTGDEDWSKRKKLSKTNSTLGSRLKNGNDRNGLTDDDLKKNQGGSASSLSDMNSGSSSTLLKGGGKLFGGDLNKRGEGRNSGDETSMNGYLNGGKRKGKRGEQDNSDGSLTLLNKDTRSNGLGDLRDTKSRQTTRDKFSNGQLLDASDGQSLHSNTTRNGQLNEKGIKGGEDETNDSDSKKSGRDQEGSATGNSSSNNGDKKGGRGGNRGGRNSGFNSQTSSQRGSKTNLLNGGGKERELVHGKGYMRASSPSQSEWGDPTHARIWASNTASSSRVSLAAMNYRDNEDEEDSSKEFVLPPIINQKRENPFSSLDFMDGFELTRAYTFSYH